MTGPVQQVLINMSPYFLYETKDSQNLTFIPMLKIWYDYDTDPVLDKCSYSRERKPLRLAVLRFF